MNPAPAAVFTIVAVCFGGAVLIVASAAWCARVCWPRLEGWCARHDNAFVAALAMSEDAGLPFAAKRRARELFLGKLSPAQRRAWYVRRRIDVVAASGRRYTIARYRPFNITTNDAAFCVHVAGTVPVYDKLLAQKLLIECNEQLFLARANVRTLSRTWPALMAAARARFPIDAPLPATTARPE